MKDHPETSETHDCGGGNLKEPRRIHRDNVAR